MSKITFIRAKMGQYSLEICLVICNVIYDYDDATCSITNIYQSSVLSRMDAATAAQFDIVIVAAIGINLTRNPIHHV